MSRRHGAQPSRWRGAAPRLIVLVPLALMLGGAEVRAGACPSSGGPSDQVLARLSLYDAGRDGPDGAVQKIQSFTEGDPGAAAGQAIVAAGPDDQARVLRLSYRLEPGRRARAGLRIKLDGLDASAYDHLELRVRGDPSVGFARALEVGFQRPRPDHPDMIESGSSLVEGISDHWRDVRVPLNRMTGLGAWTGLDELVLAVDSRQTEALAGAIYLDDLALIRTGRPGPSAADPVPTPGKDAWEQAHGGKAAARAGIAGRLRGWPTALSVPPPRLADDTAFLLQVARATWQGLTALTDREHGLPVDHVTFAGGGVEPAQAQVGDYTSPSTVGIWLMAVAGAEKLGLIGRPEAIDLIDHALATLAGLERLHGFFYNYYDTTTLERSSNFVSSVDSSWLTAGLMVVRQTFAELAEPASRLIQDGDYGWLYDQAEGLMSHGYYANLDCPSQYHYGLLYTEARVLSLIAIGKGDVPEAHWFRLQRTLPPEESWQTQPPKSRQAKQIRGQTVIGGWYERGPYRYLPSWGGSMFEALMPTLVVDETSFAPESLGRNDFVHATLQRQHALEELGYPVWGMSPSATAAGDGYGEFGVRYLGVLGYPDGVVAPYASALALAVTPGPAIQNLRALAERYPGIWGAYGFYDAVDPKSGRVALRYLTLDQGMLFVAIVNRLADHVVQRAFAADPIAVKALPILADERFFD
jgi:hypothetical protein